MAWFDIADGRLRFRRVTQEPIREWVTTEDGVAAVQTAARGIRFSLLGRTRAARRRISRTLWGAIGTPSLRESLAAECDRYLAAWTQLAYAPSLPRITVASQRLVVVPRVMIVGRIGSGITARLTACLRKADVPDPFSAFFARWIVSRMDDAIRRAGPSPHHPIYAHESWACVALDADLIWVDPLWSGPDWRGHAVMFEMPARRLQRRGRRELEDAIERLKQSLPALPRLQRDNMVRLATDQMASLRF